MFRQPEPPSMQESLKNGVAWATSCDVKQGKLFLPHNGIAQKRTEFSMCGECDMFRSSGKDFQKFILIFVSVELE